jgi:hypothetical protein
MWTKGILNQHRMQRGSNTKTKGYTQNAKSLKPKQVVKYLKKNFLIISVKAGPTVARAQQ